jgi:adenosylcobinamide-GDP ribazoletransferase
VSRYIRAVATREDWMRRLGPLYGGAVALVHSTPWRWPLEVADEPRSPGWVVALGLPIGAVAYIAAAIVRAIGMPGTLAAVFGIAALAIASAGLVEHGVVDRIDRLDGRSPSVKSTLALVFIVLGRVTALAALAPDRWLAVLVATAVLGRWAAIFLQALGDPVAEDHASRSLVATPAPLWLIAALGIATAMLAGLALGAKGGIAALALTAAGSFLLGVDAQRRDHGLSAPVVACAAAFGELCVLLVATIV